MVKHKPVIIDNENRKILITKNLLNICQDILKIENAEKEWMLSEKETICVYNCTKSYI